MVDVRDLGEVAAAALLERQRAEEALPTEVIDVVDPEVLTGDIVARIWAEVLGRPVTYGGDDVLDQLEQALTAFMPGWMAYDMRLMMRRFQIDGMVAAPGTSDRLQALLGTSDALLPRLRHRDRRHLARVSAADGAAQQHARRSWWRRRIPPL